LRIDYLVQTETKTLYLCEFKFSKNVVQSNVIKEIQNKIDTLTLPRGYSVVPVLFHFSGISDSVLDSRFFYRMIDMNDLLLPKTGSQIK
jgi:hypothetical protein